MPGSSRRNGASSIQAGDSAWLGGLAECVDAIGLDEFPDTLVAALRSLVQIDYAVSFAYFQNETPHCLFHTYSPSQRVVFVDDYLRGPYLLDPFFTACGRNVDTGLYRLGDIAPDRFYQSEYYRSYYVQTGLAEEICYTFYLEKGVAVVISLMRSGDSKKFSAREFRILDSVTPVVVSLARRHWRHLAEKFDAGHVDPNRPEVHSKIENTVSDLFNKRITPREIQVAAQVLEGHSSDAIAKTLGISVGTVRIHRRNIYAKLRISSQQELFSMFFEDITSDRQTRSA
jgi:DNA-binding CsgD family transcriptional regulator